MRKTTSLELSLVVGGITFIMILFVFPIFQPTEEPEEDEDDPLEEYLEFFSHVDEGIEYVIKHPAAPLRPHYTPW